MAKKKKKNKDMKTVLQSFKDLGDGGRETLSRLATTVKVDMPAVIAGGGNAISRLTQKLSPFATTPEKRAAKKLKKIAAQIGHHHGNAAHPYKKKRRSRLPFMVAMLVAMLGAGGYYLYQSVSLPRFEVAQYLDFDAWLDKVSGKTKTHSTQTRTGSFTAEWKREAPTTYSSSGSSSSSGARVKVGTAHVVTKKATHGSQKKSATKLAGGAKKSKAKTAKEKAWERKLAKLRKSGESKYRKASARYDGR